MEVVEIMVAQPPQDVYTAVHPVAAQYGVPDPIWETVAYMESGYNPNAVGDTGTSFGLFQLHQGGALTTSPASVMGTSGIPQNALEAMPRIGGAWSALKQSFNPNSLSWWENFAAQSGHPGGGPGNQATQNAAQAMLNDYSGSLANYSTSQVPNYTGGSSQCPFYCALIPFQAWGPCSSCDPGTNQQLQGVNSTIGMLVDPAWWARAGVFVLGFGLLVIGAIKLLK